MFVVVPTLLGVLALPAAASAAGPLGGLSTPVVTSPATTTATATTAPPVTLPSSSSGGLSTLDEVLIAVVAITVFATIAYVIRSDAREHTPSQSVREIDRERGTVAPRAERIKRSRAKTKAARRARRARRG
jgi:hypothetical protein